MNIRITLCLLALLTGNAAEAQLHYPKTRKGTQVDDYHGTKVHDPYRWLENDTSRETANWVTAQNKVTENYLSRIPFRDRLKQRISRLFNYQRHSLPFRNGSYIYYYRNNGLQDQAVLYRQNGLNGTPEIVIDPNTLSKDGTTQLADFTLSKDGRFAAWGISRAASDWQTFFVRDMTTMKDLPDTLRWVKVSEIAWSGNGFYYSRYPAPATRAELSSKNENHQVWYHKTGSPQTEDRLVYQDTLNLQRFHIVYTDEEEKFIFLSISDKGKGLSGNALYFKKEDDAHFKPLIPDVGRYLYGLVEVMADGRVLVETNHEAPNKKIIIIDPARPNPADWETLVPEGSEPIQSADMAGGKLFVRFLKDVTSRVYLYDMNGGKDEVVLPGLGTATGFTGLKDDTAVFYTFASFTTPSHVYRYHITGKKSIPFQKPALAFDPAQYVIHQEFFRSRDSTSVPMFIVHKKDIRRDGSHPAILYGYGGFNITIGPGFSPSLIAFLEQGGVYALANLRGGSEYGEQWHEAGMFEKKQNVFDDFIAAAEYLIQQKYTNSAKIAIRGGSNGGLLVGAVINQRPDLFRVAVPEVGVMDMLRFQRFTIGWNWIAEYGSSDNKKDFPYLYAYSPLHNIQPGQNYPSTMIVTADHDDRVVPAHSFKYAATLQEKYKGPNPVIIRIEENSGHGSSSIKKNIEVATDIYSFILFNLGAEWKDRK